MNRTLHDTSLARSANGLTQESLRGLLNRFASDSDQPALAYETMRRKLTLFFELRASAEPDRLADETIDRVARKLDEGVPVENLRAYFFGVAKRVLLECERRAVRERAA